MQFNDIPLRFNIYSGNLEFKTPEDQILALAAPEIVEKAVFGDFTMSYIPYTITKKKIKLIFARTSDHRDFQDSRNAHYFSSNQRPNLLRIVVGQYDLKVNDEEEKVFDVEEIAVHPHWE